SGDTVADFTAHNNDALKALVEEYGVELRQFPSEILRVLRQHTETVIEEVAESDPFVRRVNDSYQAFYAQVRDWTAISEKAYLEARAE
ncbi:MAG: ABC transporter substrate-binding protein, partial [Gammaproteobacteria bacterium]|nr:ABC transporter substrate-binding protein [Gammaproteobacteria bacterium]